MNASPEMQEYFEKIGAEIKKGYLVAGAARKKNLDPESEVPVPLAKTMAERVVGLVSVVAPQITDSKITERIAELEKEFGLLDWRVGFRIAEEVAQEKHCSFKDKIEAMEVGIRVGFAYLTLGIVSAPLEGFIGLKIKNRRDGGEYLSLQYAGPIRGAGGTAASTSVILADYVRVKMGYAAYDPTEQEINRYVIEIHDYHERVTNLQYHPSDEEIKFMVSHLPIEIDGDPTEEIEVSNYKDLPRIDTNLIRGGIALVTAEGLCQKAPKIWKRLSKWGKDFGLEWGFLSDFLKLKEKIHSQQKASSDEAIGNKKVVKANNTFIMDLVAGRPILTRPLGVGGFRLRYGRTRVSGFSAAAAHPATLVVLDKYIAIGTQLKMERPGKGATVTVCEVLEGPIVRLKNGSVLQLKTEELARQHAAEVEEILFLGDIMFNYGDFSENGHSLVPAGYCPEWWVQEAEKAIAEKFGEDKRAAAKVLQIDNFRLENLLSAPLSEFPSWEEAISISKNLCVPLHPDYTFYWKLVSGQDIALLLQWLKEGKVKVEQGGIKKIILPYYPQNEAHKNAKQVLDFMGVPHEIVNRENVVLSRQEAVILGCSLGFTDQSSLEKIGTSLEGAADKNGLDQVNSSSPVLIRDKAGTFIGARMGRPEKAKMRHLMGSPQVLFPVGDSGDRLRSFQAALIAGKVDSTFPFFYCERCKKDMIYRSCENCGDLCVQRHHCYYCGDLSKETCRHGKVFTYKNTALDINYYFNKAKERLGEKLHADLIKGVRGTSNKNHVVEHLAKGILRAKHDIYVNKEGTTRYDCTELPITHFKSKEIGTPIKKLQELGYVKDIYGRELSDEDQVIELKPQDLILPGFNSLDESAPKVLLRVAQFIDELLVKFYGLEPFYNLRKEEDLVGHLVIGLAPHISAGLVGRIIGFSETQGLLAHPTFHAGLRRDCFDKDTYLPLYNGAFWKIQKIGEAVGQLNPTDVVDNYGTKEVRVQEIKTIGLGNKMVKVHNFTKHAPQPMIKLTTKLGRTLKVTFNHKQIIYKKNKPKVVAAHELKIGDTLAIPYQLQIFKVDCANIDLFQALASKEWVMVRGVNAACKEVKEEAKKYFSKRDYDNYTTRDSYPIGFINELYQKKILKDISPLRLAAKRDTVTIPTIIPITAEFLQMIGLYVAEGYSRKVPGRLYQVYIAAENPEVREFVQKNMFALFSLKITENKKDRLTYSSRILHYLFTSVLGCGSSAYEKRIPSLFLSLPNEKLGCLLSGYFEGDGSVSPSDLRATFDTVSEGLLRDLDFVFGQMGIFVKNYTYTALPGPKVREFYVKKGRPIPSFTVTKGIIQSIFMEKFFQYVTFISSRKKNILSQLLQSHKATTIAQNYTENLMFDTVASIRLLPEEESYCLNVEGNMVIANSLLTKQCDGDEAAVILLMDTLLNFSRQFLPNSRGSTMDAPLVLTAFLNPTEVDDQVHGMDVAWNYPLELYEASLEMKNPWEVRGPGQKKVEQLADRLGTEKQYEGYGFTHPVDNFNRGVQCSAYKTLPSMEEKLLGQMEIARKVRAVDVDDVAQLVIQKHFLRDIKGNLRKFSMQQFRCIKCNEKYRRPPLINKCHQCGGRLIFTVTEGSVTKYLGLSLKLADQYNFSPYLKQTLKLVEAQVEQVFGKEKEKQVGLGSFMG